MIIDLDLDSPVTAEREPWSDRHPCVLGILGGLAVSLVAALAWLTALATTPEAPKAAPTPPTRVVSVQTEHAQGQTSAAIRRDAQGVSMAHGELFGPEPFAAQQLVSISVTVTGTGASCSITIDGQLMDQQTTGPDETSATCLWSS
jgi:hypothetical protein